MCGAGVIRFDDSAPRRLEDRAQLAAMLRSAEAELDSNGFDGRDLVEYIEIAVHERPRGEMIEAGLLLSCHLPPRRRRHELSAPQSS